MEIRDQRILVTGGAGLIGSTITDQLLEQGVAEIVILDNLSRGSVQNLEGALKDGRVRLVRGDIRDRAQVAQVMTGIDCLFHMAAIRITQCASEPRLALEVMVDGAYNVFEAAVEAQVKKVVAASSASIYGLAETFPTLEEHHPFHNRTLYGAAKTFNEGLLRSFNDMYGLDYVALRFFNVYGPRMDIHGVYTEVLVRWMERIQAGQPPLIFGDGNQTMDFVYIEDVARANILAAKSRASDVALNVARGEETSLKELAAELCRAMGADLAPVHKEVRKVNPVSRRLADTRKARELIDFTARVDLGEGLRRLVDWWQKARQEAD
jgi:UDP-glucose 4-epimerase